MMKISHEISYRIKTVCPGFVVKKWRLQFTIFGACFAKGKKTEAYSDRELSDECEATRIARFR